MHQMQLRDQIAQADVFRSLKHKGLRSTSKPLRVVWSPAQSGIK